MHALVAHVEQRQLAVAAEAAAQLRRANHVVMKSVSGTDFVFCQKSPYTENRCLTPISMRVAARARSPFSALSRAHPWE
jgi:hypothetical protein